MDDLRNPYSPGAGSRPPAIVGREQELQLFATAIGRLGIGRSAKSLMLTGLRGVGKTVLLNEFALIAREKQWQVESLEANETLDFPAAVASLVRKATLRISTSKRAAEKAKRTLAVLKSFQVRWKLPGDIVLESEPFAGLGDSGDLESDIADLFSELGTLAKEHSTGVLFTVDELQYLRQSDLAAIVSALHRMAQQQLPILLVGAGLPSLLGLIGEAKSYAERLFTFPEISSLSERDCHSALQDPAREEGVSWDQSALDAVFEASGGYPYFLQEFGKQTWDLAPGIDSITLDDVRVGIPEARRELDAGFFRVRLDRVNDSERNYLRAMASLGSSPYASGDVAKALHKTTSQVATSREGLIRRGLCFSRRYGEIEFTVPMFDDYLRRAGV
jgi:AAA ATPase domain